MHLRSFHFALCAFNMHLDNIFNPEDKKLAFFVEFLLSLHDARNWSNLSTSEEGSCEVVSSTKLKVDTVKKAICFSRLWGQDLHFQLPCVD